MDLKKKLILKHFVVHAICKFTVEELHYSRKIEFVFKNDLAIILKNGESKEETKVVGGARASSPRAFPHREYVFVVRQLCEKNRPIK